MKPEHVVAALDGARRGAVAEGNVGGGTGTSSRKIDAQSGGYTVGVLVQANHGTRDLLRVAGVPVGAEMAAQTPAADELGSIIIVVATDAPLMPHQLKRLARRASLGLARTGSISSNGSGDIFIAFSTANAGAAGASNTASVSLLSNEKIGSVFEATVDATEEAIINALVAAETMVGVDGHRAEAIPHDRLREILRKYNRLVSR